MDISKEPQRLADCKGVSDFGCRILNMIKIISFFAALLISHNVFPNNDVRIFNDKEYGYLAKYPANWIAKINRLGRVIADIANRSNTAGVNIRIYRFKGFSERSYIDRYADKVQKQLNAPVKDVDRSFIDSQVAYDIYFDADGLRKDYKLHHRIILFSDMNIAFVLQSGCLLREAVDDCQTIEFVMDSVWIYNRSKLRAP